MATLEDVDRHYQKACNAALALIEERARAIMRKNPDIDHFTMAMGSWFFWGKDDRQVEVYDEHYHATGTIVFTYTAKEWAKPLCDVFEEWDEHLKLTGVPMRFTADGPVVRDW